ncbi:crotonase/enoyl-CoA hydratase family protein [Sandaracinobacter neustonicus]|uniref:Crotonase/enoyl-CoA hydratase family protein n=1 Tax=Sandaracinobacter neustonicus TaxID=1715348 RepID=A0A501XMN7_9SPHN|nr:crotonase/enoyl-CoA hydratase family protein [Sandaracinobacter neustonicus]TPE61719.1 crotonase/enoyl-CoA hydratase family protein [Sandaracinobacter neustonicus]
MTERIRVNIQGGVADVRMIRTDKMNALDDAMFSALIETGEQLKRESGVRAVVLSGEGRAFCAGLDTSNFAGMAGGNRADSLVDTPRTPGGANRAQQAVMVWREVPVPVIAAVQGVAFGGGFQLALAADLRFATPDARMAVMEIKWGLVPDMAGIVLLRPLVRDDVFRDLTYTGRIFDGTEALALGIATRLSADPHAEALAYAADIAAKSPDAIRGAKRLLNLPASATVADVLMAESVEQTALIGSPNQIEAVMANLQKRAAVFKD